MANEQNLIPQAHVLTVEEQSSGGKASVKSRQERKAIQQMLSEYLSQNALNEPQLAKLAEKMGFKDDVSVKYLFTVVCTLNTIKKGDLYALKQLMELLGETPTVETSDAFIETEDALSKALREEAEKLNNADQ